MRHEALSQQLAGMGLPLEWEWFTDAGVVLMPAEEDEDGLPSDPGVLHRWGDDPVGPVQVAWQVAFRGADPRYRRGAWAAEWSGPAGQGGCSRGVCLRQAHTADA